jgi:hypothetical protein
MLKIGVDYFGVCDRDNTFDYLYQLKRQGHEFYLIAIVESRDSAERISEYIFRKHQSLFTKEIYVKNPLAISRFCDLWAIDLLISNDIDAICSIPIAYTIHFRHGDNNLYPHPKAMFTAHSMNEVMEIVKKSIPLHIKPIPDMYVDGMMHYLLDLYSVYCRLETYHTLE